MPEEGRTGITEECFAKNVLQFATNFTMMKSLAALEDGWERFEQNDLREGTYPEGSVWRPVGKVVMAMPIRLLMIADADADLMMTLTTLIPMVITSLIL